jgi:hypothetical protein
MDVYSILNELITKYLVESNTSNEIEFKFGKFNNIFETGVEKHELHAVAEEYKKIELLNPEENLYLNIMVNDLRIQIFDNTKKQLLEFGKTNTITNSMNYIILNKVRDNDDKTLLEYGIKLSFASEENITDKIDLATVNNILHNTKKPIIYRLLKRYTFNIIPDCLKLDLSSTKQAKGLNFKDSNIIEQPSKYEIELEIYNYKKTSLEINKIVLDNVYKIALILNGGFSLFKFSDKIKVQSEFAKKYGKNIHAHNATLDKKHVAKVKASYHVFTDKTDGFRHLLYINNIGECYLINSKDEVFNTEIINVNLRNSLFDGELVFIKELKQTDFNIFDILFLNDSDLRDYEFYNNKEISFFNIKDESVLGFNKPYYKTYNFYDKKDALIDEFDINNTNRKYLKYSKAEEISPLNAPKSRYGYLLYLFMQPFNWSNEKNTIKFQYKSFYPLNMIYNLSEKLHVLKINTNTQSISVPSNKYYSFDGLIIQSAYGTYPKQTDIGVNPQWLDSYKWKFRNNTTVDFKIINIEKNLVNNKASALLLAKYDEIWTKCEFKLNGGKLMSKDNNEVSNGEIIECNFENDTWNIIKIRYDKTYGNAKRTIAGAFEFIKNPVLLEELIE